ncbi:hypothetical protein CPY51_30235 [Rhizobium tubonense]|uniref:Uncharacterized protein n=1 Tax=Rhizobium tubonense TaxID=484088 RepID=A0A2W4E8H9_9HYPH|nr:hypothetical protein CPY51_30235 [Rhizobium tubonense]
MTLSGGTTNTPRANGKGIHQGDILKTSSALAAATLRLEPHPGSRIDPTLAAPATGNYSFADDFEGGNFSLWNTDRLKGPWSATLVPSPGRSGSTAARFELRPGDFLHDGYRSELKEKFYPVLESVQHYEITSMISPDYPLDEGSVSLIHQWHNVQDETKPVGFQYAREPVFASYYRCGSLEVYIKVLKDPSQYGSPAEFIEANYRANDQTDRGDLVGRIPDFRQGVWHDFVYQAKYSLTDGWLKGWIDGVPFVDYTGPLGYYDEPTGPYLKIGIYCKQEPRKPHIIFHDRYQHQQLAPGKSFSPNASGKVSVVGPRRSIFVG